MSPRKRLAESTTTSQNLPSAADERSADDLLDALSRLRQMARGLAHDFNNALSPVLGYAELLLEDPQIEGKQRQCLERIDAGALRAVEILRKLDLFYRDTHNRGLLSVSVAALIREIVAQDFSSASFTGASSLPDCRLELDDSLAVQADATELRILVTQLLMNAVEASNPQPSAVVVRWLRQDQSAFLEVIDRGIGMSPELCRVCCEPFQTTKCAVGAGLGLSMCHGIVRRLSGSLQIDSPPGQGTTVRIILPT